MSSVEKIKKEYEELLVQLSNPELVSDWEKLEELSKKKKELEEIINKQKELEEINKTILENKSILCSEEDADLRALADSELLQLESKKGDLEKELEKLLKRDSSSGGSSPAIIEIRAGAGGDEAGLFVASLYKMYSKCAEIKGWKQKILESHSTNLGGYKEIIFIISGKENIFETMKNEGGVHRVQRIPETEKSGRIHTSTASVAVLPKPKARDINIKTEDLKIDHYRSSGPGGQNVNKRETAVRITHTPTGLVVTSQAERNQLANKDNALAILSARLLERKQEEQIQKIRGKRKEQIGKAKRAEKIRTYNFPQDRVTDHRIKKSWHNIEEIMNGKIDKIIKALEGLIP